MKLFPHNCLGYGPRTAIDSTCAICGKRLSCLRLTRIYAPFRSATVSAARSLPTTTRHTCLACVCMLQPTYRTVCVWNEGSYRMNVRHSTCGSTMSAQMDEVIDGPEDLSRHHEGDLVCESLSSELRVAKWTQTAESSSPVILVMCGARMSAKRPAPQ